MHQQIVVTLNGSKLGEAIIPHALALASATQNGITLLRTITPPRDISLSGTVLPDDWYDREEAWTRSYLSEIAKIIQKRGIEVQIATLAGDPATNIVSYASQHLDVALIAMASHGREGVERWLLGSVATKVIQEMPRPVMVMHPRVVGQATSVPSYHHIILPLDGSPRGERVLEYARPLIHAFGAAVTLVQMEPTATGELQLGDGSEYIQLKVRQLRDAGLTVETLAPAGEPSELMTQLGIPERDALVIAAQREKIAGAVMKFIHHVGVPVLLVPIEK